MISSGAKAVLSQAKSLVDKMFSPAILFLGVSVTTTVMAAMVAAPIDTISIKPIEEPGLPSWLKIDQVDTVTKLGGQLVSLLGYKFLFVINLIGIGTYVLQQVRDDCGSNALCTGGVDAIKNALDFIFDIIQEGAKAAFETLAPPIEKAIVALMKKIGAPEIAVQFLDAFSSLAKLTKLADFDIIDIKQFQLVHLRFPTWMIYTVAILFVALFILWVASFVFSEKLEVFSHIATGVLLSALGTAVVFLVNLYYQMDTWGYTLKITYNDTTWIYALSLVSFLVSLLFFYVGSDEAEQERLELSRPTATGAHMTKMRQWDDDAMIGTTDNGDNDDYDDEEETSALNARERTQQRAVHSSRSSKTVKPGARERH